MEDKLIGRAEFFRYLFRRSASVVSQVAEGFFEPLQQVEETIHEMTTVKLIPVEQYHNTPKLITSNKPPVFLVGEKGENLTAFTALCPADGFLLNYLPLENSFYCAMCSTRHLIEHGEKKVSTDLPAYSLTIKEGYIYLIQK